MNVSLHAGVLGAEIDRALARLEQFRFADALWRGELSIWSGEPEVQRKIGNRLGWLTVLDTLRPGLDRVRGFAAGVRTGGFTDVVLLGMGGSSLAPEVMRQVLGVSAGHPRFHVLDSVDPDAVRRAMAHAATSLFVIASKSGGTIEPNTMAAEAKARVQAAGHEGWGSRFVAITDPETELHRRAVQDQFRDVFVNPADIGGRYSALSLFGLVPAALMGADVDRLLDGARAMADACRVADPRVNPGLTLGAVMGASAEAGRDKLTVVGPARLAPLGLWIEQLVAESTGKQGKGVIPIAGESPDAAYGGDRAGVVISIDGEPADAAAAGRLQASGAPVASLRMTDVYGLGAEFFRWEVATATAGWLLRINPFDEPNVQQAKDATRVLLDTYVAKGALPSPQPHAARGGMRLTLSAAAQERLDASDRFLTLLTPGDYFALLPFVAPHASAFADACERLRASVARRTGCATMFGYGPRYLHSTGQLHKGGPPSGVFIVVTAAPAEDLSIPGEPFSFGVLEQAQALGDFASLEKTGRRALLVQLPGTDAAMFDTLVDALLAAI